MRNAFVKPCLILFVAASQRHCP